MYQVQKRRRSVWFYIFLFAGAFAIGLGIGYTAVRVSFKRQQAMPEQLVVQPQQTEAEASQTPGQPASVTVTVAEPETAEEPAKQSYFVIEQSGRVCAFFIDKEGKRTFSHTLSIELDDLRAEDRKLFREGITVYSKEELSSLVEDFSS